MSPHSFADKCKSEDLFQLGFFSSPCHSKCYFCQKAKHNIIESLLICEDIFL